MVKRAPLTPLDFVAAEGIVLQSARHAQFPSLAEHVAGEPIEGSWWGHEKGREIYRALESVYASPDVVATRVVDGKVTLLHRRVWGALATLAHQHCFDARLMNKVTQEHTAAGRHEKHEEPFPDWLPRGLKLPSLEEAVKLVGQERVVALGWGAKAKRRR
jgi:hypothetical protein